MNAPVQMNMTQPTSPNGNVDLRQKSDRVAGELAQLAEEQQQSEPILQLASYLRKCWDAARRAKKPTMRKMIENAYQRRGEYTPDKEAQLVSQDTPLVFLNLTAVKCRAAESWIREIFTASDETWTLKPTPIPMLSPMTEAEIDIVVRAVVQQDPMLANEDPYEARKFIAGELESHIDERAKHAAQKMFAKMNDQLTESRWAKAIKDSIPDLVTYSAAFIKGPIVRNKPQLMWEQDPNGGWSATRGYGLTVEYDRVSPLDIYPSPTSTSIDDGYIFQLHRMSRRGLAELIGVNGYNEESIRTILNNASDQLKNWIWDDEEDEKLEMMGVDRGEYIASPDSTIVALEFWGEAQGKMLIEWGMEVDIDPEAEYQVNAWMIDHYVIKASVNPSPTGNKPYYKACYETIPGSFWGRGIPDLMRHLQDLCNAAARALARNMGICSGPQVAIDASKFAPGTVIDQIYPLKIWEYNSAENSGFTASSNKAIDFFVPDSVVNELLAVYKTFEPEAEKTTGIPSYTYGSTDVGGAGRALADYEEIITSVGPMPIGDVKAGYTIANTYGGFSFITGVYPQGESNIFRMKFSNGKHVDCDMNHRWSVKGAYDDDFRVLATREIISIGLFFEDEPHWQLPTVTTPDGEALDEAVYITGIEHVGTHTATCITVDSTDHLFLCANFIPTHNTATGLSMLMSNASKGIKMVLADVDENIIEPSIYELYVYNMLYDPDPTIKGDLSVVAKGVSSVIEKEQQSIRMIEYMNMLANNPVYLKIVGEKGIAKLLRYSAKSVNLPSEDIIPSERELEMQAMMEQRAMQAMQMEAMAGGGMMGEGQGPTGKPRTPPAPRDTTLDGQRLGGVDNGLFVNRPQ